MKTPANRSELLSSVTLREVCEWRTRLWTPVLEYALRNFSLDRIAGRRVLEIGFGSGRYSVFWAQLGAQVTGIERRSGYANRAMELANKFDVSNQCKFLDGDFFKITDKFDLIVTKSVFYTIKDSNEYERWVERISEMLRPGGEVLILENGSGSRLVQLYRKHLHKWHGYAENVLSNPVVIDIFRQYFTHVEVQPFYHYSPFLPVRPVIAYELHHPPKFANCFIFCLWGRI